MPTQREWRGLPVPYAARWTGEVKREPATVGVDPADGKLHVYYPDGNEVRDDHGVLWLREGTTRAGEPEFGELSVYRQRACMLRRKCQVCGNRIESRVIRWLLHPKQIVTNRDPRLRGEDVTLTSSPPTCDDCIEKSITLCPVMSEQRVIARVLEYEVWGVTGLLVKYDQEGVLHQSKEWGVAGYHWDFPFTQVVAKQQVVAWTKFVMED